MSGAGAQTASLVLLRNPSNPEVFWVRRGETASFLSGFHAFPGGAVDGDDHAVPVQGAEGLEAAARAAAVRELFEETGALLTEGAPAEPPSAWRASIRFENAPFSALVAREGLVIRAAALRPAGRWVAPPYLVKPFETRFFWAWAPPGLAPAVPPGDPELAEGEWIRPVDALARWSCGRSLMAPPTLSLLRALADGAAEAPKRFLRDPEASGRAARFTDLRPGITLFPLRTPTLPPATHTNCYVIGDGDEVLVVDPASPHAGEQAALDDHLAGRRVRAIVLTHGHPDHVGGVSHLATARGAPVWAHPETANRVPFPVERLLDEGDVLEIPGARLRVLHTPGHHPGHVCLLDEATHTCLVGDMVAGIGTIVVDPEDGSMAAYLASLERLRQLAPSALLPAHGAAIGGARAKLTAYIEHRLWREARVAAALSEGPSAPADLVPAAYQDVPPALWPLAERSLLAHLVKLEADGRAHRLADGRWKATAPAAL